MSSQGFESSHGGNYEVPSRLLAVLLVLVAGLGLRAVEAPAPLGNVGARLEASDQNQRRVCGVPLPPSTRTSFTRASAGSRTVGQPVGLNGWSPLLAHLLTGQPARLWGLSIGLVLGVALLFALLFKARTRTLRRRQLDLEAEVQQRTAALQSSEARFRSYLDYAPVAVIVVDGQSRGVDVNPAAVDMLGLDRPALLQLSVAELVAEEDRAAGLAHFNQVVNQGYAEGEFRLCRPDGRLLWASVRAVRLSADRFMAFCMDITERKQAETALREQLTFLQVLIDAIPNPLFFKDVHGIYTGCNRAFEQILGRSRAEIIGQTVFALAPAGLAQVYHEQDQRLLARGGTQAYESSVRLADGSHRDMLFNKATFKGPDGQLGGVVGVLSDVTERKRMERQLCKLSQALDQSSSTVVITDAQGRIEYVNPQFAVTTGYQPAEVLGQNPRLLKSGEMPVEGYRELWATILAGRQWRGEFHNKRKNGTLYWELASIAPLRDDTGTITHFVAVKEEITERKRMELALVGNNQELEVARGTLAELNQQLEQRVVERTQQVEHLLQQKQDLIDQLGHDLKTPLTPLLSLLPLLVQTETDPGRRRMVELAHEGARSIHAMLQRVLELCRVTAPDQTLSLARRPLRDLVDGALASCNRNHALHRRRLANHVSADVRVQVDESLLQQALGHLLDNAVQFTPADGRIDVRAEAREDHVIVSVADDGAGMDARHLTRAFDAFYKSDFSRHDRRAPGLGLTITRTIIERHGGRIWAQSAGSRQGTTISFTLPADSINRTN